MSMCYINKTNKKIKGLESGDVVIKEIMAGFKKVIISQSFLGEPDGFDQVIGFVLPLNEIIKIYKNQGFDIKEV